MKTILPQSRFLVFVFLLANLFFVNVSFGQIVMLDQADLDYAPGETVHITGSGWQPGETVMLEVANLTNPDVDCGPVNPQPHESWTIVADNEGNFTASWYVNDCELGADLLLGALGQTSGFTYEVFFTDAISLTPFTIGSQTGVLTSGTAGTVTYNSSMKISGAGSPVTINLGITGLPTGVSFSPASVVSSNANPYNFTLTLTTTALTPSGTFPFVVTASGTDVNTATQTGTLVVNASCIPPAAPSVNTPLTYCQGSSADVLSATGANLLWYTTATGGTGSATAPTPSTALQGTVSYYVSQTIDCESLRAKIDVVVNGINPGTIGKGAVQPGPGCGTLDPGITSISTAASGSGALSYIWQQSTNGGTDWSTISSETSSQYNPPSLTTTTYYKRIVTSLLNGVSCSAESNVLIYEVNPLPIVASILPGGTTNVCVGGTLQLTNATSGGVWSSANTGIATVDTNGLVTGITFGDVSISYTITDVNTGCSKSANKTVHVLALPYAPIAIDYSGIYDGVSHSGSATINSGETIDWYTTATGQTATVAPVGTNVGTYSAYAEARNITTGCKSTTRTLVTVTISKANPTVVVTPYNVTYDGAAHTATYTISGVNGE
ncbi:Ig-like domain (group 2), partial [Flavobacterium glycines]